MAKQKSSVTTLTHKDVLKAFGVANMTVYNWRNGTPTKAPLPYTMGEDNKLVYDLKQVAAWAKQHGVRFNPPAASEPNKQPGPVAKPKEDKKAKVAPHSKKGGVRAATEPPPPPPEDDPKPPIKVPARRDPSKVSGMGVYAKSARKSPTKQALQMMKKSKTAQKPHTPSKQGKVHSRAA